MTRFWFYVCFTSDLGLVFWVVFNATRFFSEVTP